MQTETSQVHPNVVPVPKWIRWVHIAQAVLALIVLGLVSYSLSFYNSLNIGSTYGLSFPVKIPLCSGSELVSAVR